jgi:SNF2 family DNA or RNA helicase
MDAGASFGPYITHFRNTFFTQTGYGGYDYVPKPDAEKKIFARLAPRVLRMAAEDYLELPELIIRNIEVDLPDKAMRIYKQMETALRIDFESGRVTAATSAVASMKCRQIANGGIYLSPDKWEHIHFEKANAVLDLVEELQGQPAVVAYDFHHDLERLKQVLGKDTPHIGSGVSAKKGKEHEEAWNRGELKVLLGHPQSMAHALNLQGTELGGSIIIHSLPWSFELYDQLIKRVWRQGQKKRVVVYKIVARDTIDYAILRSLEKKERTQNSLFSALKEYFNANR